MGINVKNILFYCRMQKCNSIYVWAKLKGLPSKIRWPVELLCYKTYDDQDIAEVYSKSDDMVISREKRKDQGPI